ncbi:MAG: hypothetical protein Q9173_006339 [Seirophora scorigena]
MGSASGPPEYWGYLIESDKSPSLIFEQLLLGIANYIVRVQSQAVSCDQRIKTDGPIRWQNRHVAPWNIDSLTPPKLAAFYRLLGGDYDPLFLETPHPSLSFIYQSLGCFHTLQQEKSPYKAPSVPALTPQGFVRWQTVQVLLEPDEHVSFLQNAVKRLEIINPANGTLFPSRLPREALPSRCDPEMVQWHEGVARKLMLDSRALENRRLPASKHPEFGDSTTIRSVPSSIEDPGTETARYFTHPRPRPPFRPPPSIKLPQAIDAPPSSTTDVPPPWDLERRPSSASDVPSAAASSWPRDNSTPTPFSSPLDVASIVIITIPLSSNVLTITRAVIRLAHPFRLAECYSYMAFQPSRQQMATSIHSGRHEQQARTPGA